MTDATTTYPAPGARELPRFSWRRIMQLAALYRRPLRTQWTIYAIAIPAIYLGMVFLPEWGDGLLTLLLSLLTLCAPLAFCMRDRTLVRLAPVTGAERLTFYLLYTFILAPVAMEIYFNIFQFTGSLISPLGHVRPEIYDLAAKAAKVGLSLEQAVLTGIGSYCISVLTIGAILYGALTGKNPMKAAILYGIVTYAIEMVLVVFYAAIVGFMAASKLIDDSHLATDNPGFSDAYNTEFIGQMPWMMLIIGTAALAAFVILCVKLYRRLR